MSSQKSPLIAIGIFGLLLTSVITPSLSHSGRTNSSGCHTNHSTGDYHCHNGGSSRSGSSNPSRTATPSPSDAAQASWIVVSIGDGDTIRVSRNGETTTVRLACLDAPEMAQAPYGQQSRTQLQSLLSASSDVTLRPITTDRYNRLIAEVFSQGNNINLSLVRSGHAVAYRQYLSQCDRAAYLEAEQSAQQSQSAFWSNPNPVMPWDFRRQRR